MPYKNKYCLNYLQGRRKIITWGTKKYRKDDKNFTIYFKNNI